MNLPEDSSTLLWLIGGLVLAISALSVRQLSFGTILRGILGWVLIFAVALFVVTHRYRIEAFVGDIADRLGMAEQSVDGETVRITMSDDGHFWARVTLNGSTRRMLIDSGATITALTPQTARSAGVEVDTNGFPVMLNTANGSITAQRATVERVAIGGLETRDLSVVVSPAFGSTDVIGMNFLSRLGSWRVEGRVLVLEPGKTHS